MDDAPASACFLKKTDDDNDNNYRSGAYKRSCLKSLVKTQPVIKEKMSFEI